MGHPKVPAFAFDQAWDETKGEFVTSMFSATEYDETVAYCESKLSNMLFVHKLAREQGDWLDAVGLNPGMCPESSFPLFRGIFGVFARRLAPLLGMTVTVEQAGRNLAEAALRNDRSPADRAIYYSTSPEVKADMDPALVKLGPHPCSA